LLVEHSELLGKRPDWKRLIWQDVPSGGDQLADTTEGVCFLVA
jgi:hypothetical protein